MIARHQIIRLQEVIVQRQRNRVYWKAIEGPALVCQCVYPLSV
jgi:hypothetical protein